ncbi:MAG: FAD-binding protein [Clostridia bacterium]|nr:FAD-binding protein [Clostridia bacterium]
MDSLIRALRESGIENILENEPMSRHTTMRVGGPADAVAFPSSKEQIAQALALAEKEGVARLILGAGSNVIFKDKGFRGLVIILGENFSRINVQGRIITAQAGAKLSALSTAAMRAGLSGLEFAHGIPGSVGGGVAMNAGAYAGELKDALSRVEAYSNKGFEIITVEDMQMGYRTSRALKEDLTVLSATFALGDGEPADIAARMSHLDKKRRDKQPLN